MPQEINLAGILNLQKRRKLLSSLSLKLLQGEVLVLLFPLRFSVNGTKKVISKLRSTIRLHK
jgi:hypothetical protein